jgi:hypothetical protein
MAARTLFLALFVILFLYSSYLEDLVSEVSVPSEDAPLVGGVGTRDTEALDAVEDTETDSRVMAALVMTLFHATAATQLHDVVLIQTVLQVVTFPHHAQLALGCVVLVVLVVVEVVPAVAMPAVAMPAVAR